jgi:hypothetical protein
MQYIIDIVTEIIYSMQCGGEEREKQENQNSPNRIGHVARTTR